MLNELSSGPTTSAAARAVGSVRVKLWPLFARATTIFRWRMSWPQFLPHTTRTKKCRFRREEVAERLRSGEQIPLIDVRSREEWDAVHIDGATFFTQELMQEIMSEWPKDREIIFVCHHGVRSLDAASYFAGHGFEHVRSMTGGIDAWSVEVDPDLPRYHLE